MCTHAQMCRFSINQPQYLNFFLKKKKKKNRTKKNGKKEKKILTGAFEDGTELLPSVFGTEADANSLLCSGAVLSAFVSGFMPTASSPTAFCNWWKRSRNGSYWLVWFYTTSVILNFT